jgi:hypothetical protein
MTPSARIVAVATEQQTITDASGRKLGLRRLTALDKLRLFKAAGPELAQNDAWLGMAMLANSVIAIDDVPIPSATNEQQIEAMVGRLGDVGIAAVADVLLPTSGADRSELVTNAGN